MESAGLKTTEPRNSADHRSGLSLSVAPTNSNQLWLALEAFGLIWKKEPTLGLILEETGSRIRQNRGFQTAYFP
jgi:hypothetical protein